MGLRWTDLDADGGLLVRQAIEEVASATLRPEDRVCRTCGGQHTELLVKAPTSRSGTRRVPLVRATQAVPQARQPEVPVGRDAVGDGYRDHDHFFCRSTGDRLRPGTVTSAFEAQVTRHGLAGYEPVDAGPLTVARYLEPLCSFTVTLAYAQSMGSHLGLKLVRA